VVLVGGGHAHLRVLREAARSPWRGASLTLISQFDHHHYSGMVPGYLRGRYREGDLRFDLAGLCRAAGAAFVRGLAERVSATERIVEVDGERVPFDLVSLDVGAAPAGMEVPGVREHAFTVRPMSRVVALRKRMDALIGGMGAGEPVRACVVGAGAAGVEVALALHRRIERGGRRPEVTLLDRGALLPGYSAGLRARAREVLRTRGVALATEEDVVEVRADGALTSAGDRVPADITVWLTGAAPPRLLDRSDLPRSGDGFLLVDSSLRSADGAPVWGAGDCITLRQHPEVPKAGVYAVRAAPVLAHNLRAAVEGGPPREFLPQSSFLSLLDTSDGRARLRWRALAVHSRWAWWLKRRIDERFVRRYQRIG
jgi:selenide,water dikinase